MFKKLGKHFVSHVGYRWKKFVYRPFQINQFKSKYSLITSSYMNDNIIKYDMVKY